MSLTKPKFYELIEDLFDMTQNHETMDPMALGLKLGEEVGEFQEAVLVEHGYLQHKELKEDTLHEAADIICVLIGFLAKHHPNLTSPQLTEMLYEAIAKKGEKYANIVGA